MRIAENGKDLFAAEDRERAEKRARVLTEYSDSFRVLQRVPRQKILLFFPCSSVVSVATNVFKAGKSSRTAVYSMMPRDWERRG